MNSEARSRCKGRLIESEEKREAGVVEVHLSLESLERRVEERLNQKVNFLLERLDNAVQVHKQIGRLELFRVTICRAWNRTRGTKRWA